MDKRERVIGLKVSDKLREKIRSAVADRDLLYLNKLTSYLIHKVRMNWREMHEFINGIHPIHESEWDMILGEVDMFDTGRLNDLGGS